MKVKPKATIPSVTIRGQRKRENAVPMLRTGEPSLLCTELNKGADRATCHTPRPAPHAHLLKSHQPGAWRPWPHWEEKLPSTGHLSISRGFPRKAQDITVPRLQEEGPENDHRGPASSPSPRPVLLPQDRTAVPEPSQSHINLLSKQLGRNHSQILIYKEKGQESL